jgi:UPF0271 protein
MDLNCDLGEGFGPFLTQDDAGLLDEVSSANIACGYHAGDPAIMRRTVRLCLDKGVAIGAHPGLPDLHGFGRREMAISPREAYELVLYQVGALYAFVRAEGGVLHHVKPHGALYNMAAQDASLAQAIVDAILHFDDQLWLYGLAGSELITAAQQAGLPYAAEAFADRRYRSDGKLKPRSEADAVLSHEEAIQQALAIAQHCRVHTLEGEVVPIQADTLCVHGDGSRARKLLQELRKKLVREGLCISSPGTGG